VKTNRREFLRTAGWASLALLGLPRGARGGSEHVLPDPDRLLALAPGFSYRVIARTGEPMSDGLIMPGSPDGTGVFRGPNGRLILVRNHEQGAYPRGTSPYGGEAFERLDRIDLDRVFDPGTGRRPMLGGTTTLVYDPASGAVEASWLSLAGTLRNCAGGVTPWGSWLTCEEYPGNAGGELGRDHGFVFEVPASAEPSLTKAVPLTAMGRFNHEAAAVDPASGAVYLTEDRADSLFYRFLPEVPGQLARGGKLQALRLREAPDDTRSWKDSPRFPVGRALAVDWVTLDGVEAPLDDLRARGHKEKGAAWFGRGEGIWASSQGIFFTATMGDARPDLPLRAERARRPDRRVHAPRHARGLPRVRRERLAVLPGQHHRRALGRPVRVRGRLRGQRRSDSHPPQRRDHRHRPQPVQRLRAHRRVLRARRQDAVRERAEPGHHLRDHRPVPRLRLSARRSTRSPRRCDRIRACTS
jgi:secreted PhoX family phosphatase